MRIYIRKAGIGFNAHYGKRGAELGLAFNPTGWGSRPDLAKRDLNEQERRLLRLKLAHELGL